MTLHYQDLGSASGRFKQILYKPEVFPRYWLWRVIMQKNVILYTRFQTWGPFLESPDN